MRGFTRAPNPLRTDSNRKSAPKSARGIRQSKDAEAPCKHGCGFSERDLTEQQIAAGDEENQRRQLIGNTDVIFKESGHAPAISGYSDSFIFAAHVFSPPIARPFLLSAARIVCIE